MRMRKALCTTCLMVIAFIVGAEIATRIALYKPPTLAPSWKAHVRVFGGGYIYNDTLGHFLSDSAHQRFRLSVRTHTNIFNPDENQVIDYLIKKVPGAYMNFTYGIGPAATCHPFQIVGRDYSSGGGDPFWWLPFSQYNGTQTVDGEECTSWVFVSKGVVASACIGSDNAPRYLLHSPLASTLAYASSSAFGGFLLFSNVSVTELYDRDFVESVACRHDYPPRLCAENKLKSFDVYRLQARDEPLDLLNKNAGDLLGDLFFACVTMRQKEDRRVVRYSVLANVSFGQFNQCQWDPVKKVNYCSGDPGKQVGRGSPENLGGNPRGGQCSMNEETGSWYSFPASGECRAGEMIGTNGCTWRAQLQHVVELSCVMSARGLAASCKKEKGKPPFNNSAEIFRAALASNDPEKGGCPYPAPSPSSLVYL